MNLKNLILGLGLGFLATNALPYDGEKSLNLREAQPLLEANSNLNVFQERAAASKALVKTIQNPDCDREGLYVPMLYAGWMQRDGQKYDRYNCDLTSQDTKCVREKQPSKGEVNMPQSIVTDQLASCLSINIMTDKGAILAHINPGLCTLLNGGQFDDPTGALQKQADGLKSSCKTLFKKHEKTMGGRSNMVVAVVAGPYGDDQSEQRAQNAFNDLFGVQTNEVNSFRFWKLEKRGTPTGPPNVEGERTTTIDMTGDKVRFWKENDLTDIEI